MLFLSNRSRSHGTGTWQPGSGLRFACCCAWMLASPVLAQESTTEADLAKTVQNPLARLVSLPLQFNFNDGARPPGSTQDRRVFNLNVQPVIPFPGETWDIITRTIIPINSVPMGDTDSEFGLGDISLSVFWSPKGTGRLTWGVGPAISLPTASNPEVLGTGKLSIGPTGVVFYAVGKWTLGAVANNVWSVAGEANRQDVNRFFGQWFANYNIGSGWAVGTAPIVTCDWETSSGDACTIPWGLQVSKVTHFGDRPVNLLLGYYKNSTYPAGAPTDQLRIQVNFLFPRKAKS